MVKKWGTFLEGLWLFGGFMGGLVLCVLLAKGCDSVHAQTTPPDVRARLEAGFYTFAATWPADPDGDLDKVCFAVDTDGVLDSLGCVSMPLSQGGDDGTGFGAVVAPDGTRFDVELSSTGEVALLQTVQVARPAVSDTVAVRAFAVDVAGNESDPSANAAVVDFKPPAAVRMLGVR